MPVHSHGDVSHDHPDAAPGHTHDTDAVQPAPPTPPTTQTVPTAPVAGAPVATAPAAAAVATAGFVTRAILTVLGAAAIIGGAFLSWLRPGEPAPGIRAPIKVFWGTTGLNEVGFASSAGLVVIIIGLIALIGLALPTGWLTRLAGALAIIAFVLFLITLYRIDALELGAGNIGVGMWLILAGGVLAVVGGFFGARPRPVAAV